MKTIDNFVEDEQLADLAKVVHGGLASLHALGAVYNFRRGRYLDATLHAAVAIYDLMSAMKHSRKEVYLSDKIREGL